MGSSLTQQKNIFACVLRIAQSIFSFSASGIDPVVLEIQRIFEFFFWSLDFCLEEMVTRSGRKQSNKPSSSSAAESSSKSPKNESSPPPAAAKVAICYWLVKQQFCRIF
jgi:hypothetical protein